MKRFKNCFLILFVSSWVWLGACTPATPPPTATPAATSTPTLAVELTLYNWEDDLPQAVLDQFTAEYGVPVVYESYETQGEALDNIRSGQQYDVLVLDNNFLPAIIADGLLAPLDHDRLPNLQNIDPIFLNLAYDPQNQHSIPYNWGTTGLLVRNDLTPTPVTRWADLWESAYSGPVGLWPDMRVVIGAALKSLGYSANSSDPTELAQAGERLQALKPRMYVWQEQDSSDLVELLSSGEVPVGIGFVYDAFESRAENEQIEYVLPEDGALLWGDSFVIPANSPHQHTAQIFLDFLMRPDVTARIVNENYYATANQAALPFIEPEIRNDPLVFPTNKSLTGAEVILPLDPEIEPLYAEIWAEFIE